MEKCAMLICDMGLKDSYKCVKSPVVAREIFFTSINWLYMLKLCKFFKDLIKWFNLASSSWLLLLPASTPNWLYMSNAS